MVPMYDFRLCKFLLVGNRNDYIQPQIMHTTDHGSECTHRRSVRTTLMFMSRHSTTDERPLDSVMCIARLSVIWRLLRRFGTRDVELSCFWEADSSLPNQEIPRSLWYWKVNIGSSSKTETWTVVLPQT